MKPPVRNLRCKHDVPGLRYGTLEVKKGDLLKDVPAGAAAEMVAIGNYEYAPISGVETEDDPSLPRLDPNADPNAPNATASSGVQAPAKTSTRRKSGPS